MIHVSSPTFSGNELAYVSACVESGVISCHSDFVRRFEGIFADRFGMSAVSCTSGTAALHLALLAAGIGPGDEVILPDLTFAATVNVVLHVGAKPVLVDVDANWNIDPHKVEMAITSATRAIISVDLYGQPCQIGALKEIRLRHGIILIEDRAESLTERETVEGDYGCFSFFANKHITTGEGGMVLCHNEERVRLFQSHGMAVPYEHEVAGLNYRMTGLQAALGVAQMERLDELTLGRKRTIQRYALNGLEGRGNWLFVITVGDPLYMANALKSHGIETRPVFKPLHLQTPYRRTGAFPNAVRAWKTGLCLPTGPHLSNEEIDFISAKVLQVIHV